MAVLHRPGRSLSAYPMLPWCHAHPQVTQWGLTHLSPGVCDRETHGTCTEATEVAPTRVVPVQAPSPPVRFASGGPNGMGNDHTTMAMPTPLGAPHLDAYGSPTQQTQTQDTWVGTLSTAAEGHNPPLQQ